MKSLFSRRSSAALLLIFCLFAAPLPVFAAKKGEKNFKQGLRYEVAKQWDKAVEEFALAVAANPGNPEFGLHYRRALFNASQLMMERGRTLAEQKDYVGAYNSFRQAYGYDPVNELARDEMERMLRLQREANGDVPISPDTPNTPKGEIGTPPQSPSQNVKLVPTAYTTNAAGTVVPAAGQPAFVPQIEELRDVKFTKTDLKTVIRELGRDLDLNVLFDTETFRSPRDLTIELRNVTTAQALDNIFLQEGLFFERTGKRTILVANNNRRQNFQQLVLRTFFIANANPEELRTVISQAIPPQPGRAPTIVIVDKPTNSLTVRDTAENIKLIGRLINSLDKDRAEVVMDVNIYEVSKTDLLQLGLQIGDANSLVNLGGTSSGVVGIGENAFRGTVGGANGSTPVTIANRAIGGGLILPSAQLRAFEEKGNTRLLAATQIHAFNGEESQARIGQRVPVQTAQLLGLNTSTTGQQNPNNFGFGNPASVVNYEQIGLTLNFTPLVFPNQDVQVKMKIESKDVVSAGATPTFSERTITGTARIQNNRTMMLANVAQDVESNGRSGIPFLSGIPILGRLFSAPSKNNRRVDIVIAVTPRVLRGPTIQPEDEVDRPTGTLASPTGSSLATLVNQENYEDQMAAARRLPTTAVIQVPDQPVEAPAYVPAKVETTVAAQTVVAASNGAPATVPTANQNAGNSLQTVVPRPISTSVKTLQIAPTADVAQPVTVSPVPSVEVPTAEIKLAEPLAAMKAGERRRVAVAINSVKPFRHAMIAVGYNQGQTKIVQITHGEIFGAAMVNKETPFFNRDGRVFVTLQNSANATASGTIAYLDIEAIADGLPELRFDAETMKLVSENGETMALRFNN